MVDPLGPQPLRAAFAAPRPLALALPARHSQPFLPPEPLHPLGVDLHPGSPQQGRGHAVARTRVLRGNAPQFRGQRRSLPRLPPR